MLAFIFVLACLGQQDSVPEVSELPGWVKADSEPGTFVVETQVFNTNFAAAESLLPAIRTDVLNWAKETFGEGSAAIVESMPLEDFERLVHQNNSVIYKDHRVYDAETSQRLGTDHADEYCGFVQVCISDEFRDRVELRLAKTRLKHRLCTTLIGAIFALGIMGITWGYLFTSLKTRGFYVSRLRWFAGLLICMLLVVCYAVSLLLV